MDGLNETDARPAGLAPPAIDAGSDVVRLEAERARLRAEIDAARERIATATLRAAERDAASREALRAELLAARSTVAELERHHLERVAELRAATDREVEAILTTARRTVGRMPGQTAHGDLEAPDVE